MVSSSLIRAMLRLGKIREANRMLGRIYGVTGRVVAGKGRGAKVLGVPTANLASENDLLPSSGIYAVWVRLNGARLPGVANIGTCPTFANEELTLEVHLLDFDGDLYGESCAGGVCAAAQGGEALPLHRRAGGPDPGRHGGSPEGAGQGKGTLQAEGLKNGLHDLSGRAMRQPAGVDPNSLAPVF